MKTRSYIGLMLSALPLVAFADELSPPIPDTPAGRTLAAWLQAFNSGGRAGDEAFARTYSWTTDPDGDTRWKAETGGYDLLAIYTNDQTHILFRLKARATGGEEIGTIQLSAAEPRVLTELGTFRVAAGSRFEAIKLDDAMRARVINKVADVLDDSYVFPETAQKMSTALRKRKTSRDYRAIRDGRDFARQLTLDLQEISHDKHLEVRFSYVVVPADPPGRDPGDDSKRLAADNCGFEKAEHLPPNIGYLKFNEFADTDICAGTAIAAMNFLADSDALIIDLRDNHGGRPAMVTLIASYLFAEPTRLNDAYDRRENTMKQCWTAPFVLGKRFIDRPVFLLTSGQTFSAAEDFGYALKNLKRATLIGETTGGGAHPIGPRRIDDHFTVIVPSGRSISPITKTDWEGTGVEPDVRVAAADALDEALKRARGQTTGLRSPR